MEGSAQQTPITQELEALRHALEEQGRLAESLEERLGSVATAQSPSIASAVADEDFEVPGESSALRKQLNQLAAKARDTNDRLISLLNRIEL